MVETLWSPWRYEYLNSAGSEQPLTSACVFCDLHQNQDDDENKFILKRATHNYVVLNLYPYISGHLLIVPNEHVGDLDIAAKAITDELMDLTKQCQTALRKVYRPDGFNVGMNLGRAAGAGIADHIHIHILPRWAGDTNFMTSVAEARVLPEDLSTTYEKLRGEFRE